MNRKRMPLVLALAAVVVLAALGWLLPLTKSSQAAPAPAPDASFKGKLLLVRTSEMWSLFLLEKVQVQKIGEHSWLTGKGAADGRMGEGYKGRTVRLQMEHIVSIIEFDDLKDAKKAVESGMGGPTAVYGGAAIGSYTAPVVVPAAPAGQALPVPPPPPPAPPSK